MASSHHHHPNHYDDDHHPNHYDDDHHPNHYDTPLVSSRGTWPIWLFCTRISIWQIASANIDN